MPEEDMGLRGLRQRVTYALTGLLWVHVPLNVLVAYALARNVLFIALVSATMAGAATLSMLVVGSALQTRLVVAVALIGTISLLVAQFTGNPWQVDLHMYYFAALAVLTGYCDWRVLVVAAILVAVHHLGLNIWLPAAIYPGGASYPRVLLHSTIVILETVALSLVAHTLNSLFQSAAADAADARAARLAERRADAERRTTQDRAGAARKEATASLLVAFEASIDTLVSDVALDAAETQSAIRLLSDMTEQVAERSAAISLSGSEADTGVQGIAAAAEELAMSISEITHQVGRASTMAQAAALEAGQTSATMRDLATAGERIGNVIQLIGDIAARTNLLALNATIEASRAGDAGRGFAVVAAEVKALAAQTARATEEVQTQVAAIRSQTSRAVDAIEAIVGTVGGLDEVTSVVMASIEQQGDVTREIAQGASRAAAGTEGVTINLGSLSRATEETGAAAHSALGAASDLQVRAAMLNDKVRLFVKGLRATG